jgi:hypothetical protein
LVACRNPELAKLRTHKREELLAAAEANLENGLVENSRIFSNPTQQHLDLLKLWAGPGTGFSHWRRLHAPCESREAGHRVDAILRGYRINSSARTSSD